MGEPSETPVRMLTTVEAAALLNLRPGTLERLRRQGAGPPFKRHSGHIFYLRTDLESWSRISRPHLSKAILVKRVGLLASMLALLVFLLALHLWKRPLLIWNTSPSVPTGLYWIMQSPPRFDDLVILRLPERIARLAQRSGYLAASVYLLKPVAALAGDRVCRFGTHIFVRNRFKALAIAKDRHLRMMPTWQGCRTLITGELFLIADHPTSFDSRYFGPINTDRVSGIAVLVWPDRVI